MLTGRKPPQTPCGLASLLGGLLEALTFEVIEWRYFHLVCASWSFCIYGPLPLVLAIYNAPCMTRVLNLIPCSLLLQRGSYPTTVCTWQ